MGGADVLLPMLNVTLDSKNNKPQNKAQNWNEWKQITRNGVADKSAGVMTLDGRCLIIFFGLKETWPKREPFSDGGTATC